jgi:hypothetical protein
MSGAMGDKQQPHKKQPALQTEAKKGFKAGITNVAVAAVKNAVLGADLLTDVDPMTMIAKAVAKRVGKYMVKKLVNIAIEQHRGPDGQSGLFVTEAGECNGFYRRKDNQTEVPDTLSVGFFSARRHFAERTAPQGKEFYSQKMTQLEWLSVRCGTISGTDRPHEWPPDHSFLYDGAFGSFTPLRKRSDTDQWSFLSRGMEEMFSASPFFYENPNGHVLYFDRGDLCWCLVEPTVFSPSSISSSRAAAVTTWGWRIGGLVESTDEAELADCIRSPIPSLRWCQVEPTVVSPSSISSSSSSNDDTASAAAAAATTLQHPDTAETYPNTADFLYTQQNSNSAGIYFAKQNKVFIQWRDWAIKGGYALPPITSVVPFDDGGENSLTKESQRTARQCCPLYEGPDHSPLLPLIQPTADDRELSKQGSLQPGDAPHDPRKRAKLWLSQNIEADLTKSSWSRDFSVWEGPRLLDRPKLCGEFGLEEFNRVSTIQPGKVVGVISWDPGLYTLSACVKPKDRVNCMDKKAKTVSCYDSKGRKKPLPFCFDGVPPDHGRWSGFYDQAVHIDRVVSGFWKHLGKSRNKRVPMNTGRYSPYNKHMTSQYHPVHSAQDETLAAKHALEGVEALLEGVEALLEDAEEGQLEAAHQAVEAAQQVVAMKIAAEVEAQRTCGNHCDTVAVEHPLGISWSPEDGGWVVAEQKKIWDVQRYWRS